MSKLNESRVAFLTFLLVSICGTAAFAGGVGGQPVSGHASILPLTQVQSLDLPTVDRQEAALVDARRLEDGQPFRFAESRQVDLTPDNSGTWEMLPSTDRLWRLRVSCEKALSLNLGFSEFQLPTGSQLRVFAVDGSGPVLVFDDKDNRGHGQLWTPVLMTEELVVEFQVPSRVEGSWHLRLGAVGCGYRYFGQEPADKSGTCNIDVICPEGNGWREEIATVGVFTVGGTWKCTGTLINNTDQDGRPLFLTAHHCDVDEYVDSSVVVYWNFESPVCGDQGPGSLTQYSSGSTWLAGYQETDFCLLELDNSPDPTFGVNLAGWDRSAIVPGSAVCIHHPSTDEKSISFENDQLQITSYSSSESPGNGTHLEVLDWDQGTTEPGSSGAPLFNASKLIVGQLHGGYAACYNDLPDWYGRLNISWTGGGTDQSRLSNWLDPQGLGNITLALLNPDDDPVIEPATNANIRISGLAPNPFQDFVEVTVEMDRAASATGKIYDMSGRLVADLGTVSLEMGENVFGWVGLDQDGRRTPAGLYILVMVSEGKTARQTLMRLN